MSLVDLAYWTGVSNGAFFLAGVSIFAYGAHQLWKAWSEGRPKRDKRTGRYTKHNQDAP